MYAKARIGLLALVALFVLLPSAGKSQSRQRMAVPEDMERWIKTVFAKGHVPPFSFVYDGKPSAQFIRKWKYSASKGASDEAGTIKYLFTYTDPVTGLKVACRVTGFEEFGAVEWMLYFTNTSQRNSAMLTDVKVTDFGMEAGKDASFTLHHAVGSNGGRDDFWPLSTPVETDKSVYITPEGGRSSDHTGFPFMNLEASNGRGAIVAVGWTGNWYVDVSQQTPGTATLASGMKNMNLYLLPDETIRTPLVCMLFWQGEDRMVGHNTFRRFMLAHHSPKLNGRFAEYPFSGGYSWGDPAPCNEYCCLTEDFALALTKRYAQFGIVPEVFWLDAGWYKGCGGPDFTGKNWYNTVGTWEVDEKRFPNGLKPLSEAAHEAGAKFMVWFEPERVAVGSQIAEEHPEWLLKRSNDPNNLLFDLGNPEALNWMCEHIGDLIEKNGIDYYRQDFNMHISPYWAEADEPDRVGIHEIRHVEGLYAYWDYLRERFPGLLIDNCAGGGRRLDLETMSRSAPLWRTDYSYGEVNGYQCHTYGLNFYLPIHGTRSLQDRSVQRPLGSRQRRRAELEAQRARRLDRRHATDHRPIQGAPALLLRGLLSADGNGPRADLRQCMARLPDAPSVGPERYRRRFPPQGQSAGLDPRPVAGRRSGEDLPSAERQRRNGHDPLGRGAGRGHRPADRRGAGLVAAALFGSRGINPHPLRES